ncbi:hypothetical protein ACOL3F_02225 [Aliarcobacter butzleri]
MNAKKFILNYDMKKLVQSSKDYKNYMQSDEIQQFQSKIDLELTKMEKEWKVFIDIYRSLDTNKEEFTIKAKLQRDQQRLEQKIKEENEKESVQIVEQFREKLEMLKMSLKVYETKEE